MKQNDSTEFENWLHKQTKRFAEPEVSAEFLAAQRRSIYRRMDDPRRTWMPMRWAFSLALLLMMIVGGVSLERRHRASSVSSTAISDDQLFSDLTAMDQSNEPKAIQPIHGLFQ